jgi:Ca2+/Na+ antiporter
MELRETIFIVAALVMGIGCLIYLNKFKTTKTEVVFSAVGYVFLLTMFSYNLIERFSYVRLSMVLLLTVYGVYVVIRKYKKFKKESLAN